MSRLIPGEHFYLSEKIRNRYYMYFFYVARKEGGFLPQSLFPNNFISQVPIGGGENWSPVYSFSIHVPKSGGGENFLFQLLPTIKKIKMPECYCCYMLINVKYPLKQKEFFYM